MRTIVPSSLTGGECGAPPTHTPSVSLALGQLRFGVSLCCWAIALLIMLQMGIWALATFTGLRFTIIEPLTQAPVIVQPSEERAEGPRSALDPVPVAAPVARQPVNPNRVLSPWDRVFDTSASLAGGFGALITIVLIPLIGLGVLLAASSSTHGVEKTVSAFGWSLVVGLLVIPIARTIGLPWDDGAFWSYVRLAEWLDAGLAEGKPAHRAGIEQVIFLSRYVVLPGTGLVGIAIVGMRFHSGVQAGLIRAENLQIDPVLEREAGNIKISSLHGTRGASIKQTLDRDGAAAPEAKPVLKTAAGEAPRRLI